MLNAYQVLGVKHEDDLATVKKQYRKLANKHHPDKGGDEAKFKEIKEAYELIKMNLDRRSKYKVADENTFNEENYKEYTFGNANDFSFHFQQRRQPPNRFVNINASISLHHAVNGGTYTLSIQLNGQHDASMIEIDVPKGVIHGDTIRYPNVLGNGSIDLNVTFVLIPDANWDINGIDLTKREEFSIWDLINGTTREVLTIADGKVRVKIPPMTQPGTKLKLKSLGAMSRQNVLHKGDMYVEVVAKIPEHIPAELLSLIKDM